MIFLKTMRGKTFFVNQDADDDLITPRQILDRLAYLSNWDIDQFRLVFAGRAVEGASLDQNVREHGWVYGRVVHIVALTPEAREFLETTDTDIQVSPLAAGFRP